MEDIGNGWDVPSEVKQELEWRWFHVPPGGGLVLVVLSPEPVYYVGHFVHGRMEHCSGDVCGHCALGLGRQIRFVFGVADIVSREVGVLEVGTPVAGVLRDHARSNGGLRGTIVELSRVSRKKQARLEVEIVKEQAPGWSRMLPSLDLHAVLHRTWQRLKASQ